MSQMWTQINVAVKWLQSSETLRQSSLRTQLVTVSYHSRPLITREAPAPHQLIWSDERSRFLPFYGRHRSPAWCLCRVMIEEHCSALRAMLRKHSSDKTTIFSGNWPRLPHHGHSISAPPPNKNPNLARSWKHEASLVQTQTECDIFLHLFIGVVSQAPTHSLMARLSRWPERPRFKGSCVKCFQLYCAASRHGWRV